MGTLVKFPNSRCVSLASVDKALEFVRYHLSNFYTLLKSHNSQDKDLALVHLDMVHDALKASTGLKWQDTYKCGNLWCDVEKDYKINPESQDALYKLRLVDENGHAIKDSDAAVAIPHFVSCHGMVCKEIDQGSNLWGLSECIGELQGSQVVL